METNAVDTSNMTKEEALVYLRDEWGWSGLQEIRRYLSTPPRYVAIVNGERVELGTAETLLSQRKLRLRVFEATHHLLRWVDQRYWDDMVKLIARATTDYAAPEAEELDWLVGLLEAYLDAYKPAEEGDESAWKSHLRMELPIERGGSILVHATHLATWASTRGNKIRPRELAFILRKYGAESVRVALKGGTVHRRYWMLPHTLTPWYDGGVEEGLKVGDGADFDDRPVLNEPPDIDELFLGEKDEQPSHEKEVVATDSAPSSTQKDDLVAALPHEKKDVATGSEPSSTQKDKGVATLPASDKTRARDPEKEKPNGNVATGGGNAVLNGINPVATSFSHVATMATGSGIGGGGGVKGDVDDDWF
jgi:hypothetical protein